MGTRGARLRPSPDVNFMWAARFGDLGRQRQSDQCTPGWGCLNHHCAVLRPGSAGSIYAQRTVDSQPGGIDGLGVKVGRQYLVFGNQRLFGHFDWANTGYSHDGIMLSYATPAFDTKLSWFRHSGETDLGQADPGGSLTPNL